MTLFFDLGGVLLFFSHELMCRQVAEFCGLPLDKVVEIIDKKIAPHYELGHISSRQLHLLFCQMTQKALDFSGFMHAAGSIFSPNLEMLPVLLSLKKSGKKLFLLSNTCEAHFLYAKKNYSFLNLFDGFILSYEIKKRKPDEEFFVHALNHTKTPKEDCFYIDDLSENIEAAQCLGIDSHQFLSADHLIAAMKERKIL